MTCPNCRQPEPCPCDRRAARASVALIVALMLYATAALCLVARGWSLNAP